MKKRFTTILLTLCVLLTLLPGAALASSGTCGADLSWTLDDTGILTISGTGKMDNYSQAAPWYGARGSIRTVNIKRGPTLIGLKAFKDCTNLTSVTIPLDIISIGNEAFCNTGLISADVPYGVVGLGYRSFGYCSNLTSIVLPETLTSIGNQTFFMSDNLRDVYYAGTQEQWAKVTKGTGNENLLAAAIHYNSNGPKPSTVTVSFHANGGAVSLASKEVTIGKAYQGMPLPVWEGHTFTGWYTAISGGVKVGADTVVTKESDHTLFAHWKTTAKPNPKVAIREQYLFAGNNKNWAEDAYYASPVVADLDGDGKLEVIRAAYSLIVMDAATGTEKWRVNSGRDITTPYSEKGNVGLQIFTDIEVTDLDGDGKKEIIAAYGNGSVSVLDSNGKFKAGWPQKPTSVSLRSLAVGDLDGDGKQEIVVGAGIAASASVWVYRSNGTLMSGWPQLAAAQDGTKNPAISGTAYSYGVFADGISLGDLDGDGKLDIIVPTDNQFINAYHADGSLVYASEIYGPRAWGKISLYEDPWQELLCLNEGHGWGIKGGESRAELYRATLGHAGTVFTDVDGDGTSELVVTALMLDRTNHSKTNVGTIADTRYMTAFILNGDRTRYCNPSLGFDWTSAPVDLGASLKKNSPESVAAGVFSEPVCADLDGDGYKEILFNSYNGKLHCFSLDGTEHDAWPYQLPKTTASVYEYATPPACADLNGDGQMEVIFASWTDNESGKNTGVNGALYILGSNGALLARTELHGSYAGMTAHSNGCMAAPVVQDIDGDGKYEILLNTTYYALCAYEVSVAS